MFSYADDWDGMGSSPPSHDIVLSAIELTETLQNSGDYRPPCRVIATASGTVGLEWQGQDFYMEVEITEPFHSEWMMVDAGKKSHWEMDNVRRILPVKTDRMEIPERRSTS